MASDILANLKKRWIWILCCAVLGVILMVGERLYLSPKIPASNGILVMTLIKIEGVSKSIERPLEYNKYFMSYPMELKFIEECENKYDFNKLNSNWASLTDRDKAAWMQSHFMFNNMNDGIIELVVELKETDPKDIDYVNMNIADINKDYIDFMEKELKLISSQFMITQIENRKIATNNGTIATNEGISKKYIIIGFILGSLVGVTVFILQGIRKYHVK